MWMATGGDGWDGDKFDGDGLGWGRLQVGTVGDGDNFYGDGWGQIPVPVQHCRSL